MIQPEPEPEPESEHSNTSIQHTAQSLNELDFVLEHLNSMSNHTHSLHEESLDLAIPSFDSRKLSIQDLESPKQKDVTEKLEETVDLFYEEYSELRKSKYPSILISEHRFQGNSRTWIPLKKNSLNYLNNSNSKTHPSNNDRTLCPISKNHCKKNKPN
jgi:hypothetical protein